MSTGILDDIDRAISDCAVSGDAMRWTPEPPKPAPSHAQMAEMIRLACENLAAVLRPALDAVRAAHEHLVAAGIVHHEPPQDPRERALAARRNRNTGPQVPARPPRRIDPRGLRR